MQEYGDPVNASDPLAWETKIAMSKRAMGIKKQERAGLYGSAGF